MLLWLTLITMLLPVSAMVLPLFLELNLAHLINTQWAVVLPAMFFPFGVYLSYVYYGSSLPGELVDAARVDGCSELRVFWNLALPLARPLLGLLAFISFNANWNNFFGPYVMLNNDKLYNMPVGLNSVVAGDVGAPSRLQSHAWSDVLRTGRRRDGRLVHDRPGRDRLHLLDEVRDERRVHRRSQGLIFDPQISAVRAAFLWPYGAPVMTSDRLTADLAFIGHVCFDEVIPFGGSPRVAPGSAVLCGALAAARIGTKVAVVTRMAPKDEEILEPMRQSGIAVHVIPAEDTTYMRVVHPSADVDEREMYQLANAGLFAPADIPALAVRQVHLAGITDQEFDLDFVRGMKARGYRLVGRHAELRAPGRSGHAPDLVRGRRRQGGDRRPSGHGQARRRRGQGAHRHRRPRAGGHRVRSVGLPRST